MHDHAVLQDVSESSPRILAGTLSAGSAQLVGCRAQLHLFAPLAAADPCYGAFQCGCSVGRHKRQLAEMCVKAVLAVADLERRDVNLDLIKVGWRLGVGVSPLAATTLAGEGRLGGVASMPCCTRRGMSPLACRPAAGRQGGRAAGGHRAGQRHRAGQGHVAPAGEARPCRRAGFESPGSAAVSDRLERGLGPVPDSNFTACPPVCAPADAQAAAGREDCHPDLPL